MSRMYRGTEIFQPPNTGWIDGHVACVREWVANIFFYRKDGTTIMMDTGYNYNRLAEKMAWLGIAPESIRHILITQQDTDHVGAVAEDNRLAVRSLAELEEKLCTRGLRPLFITGHTGWTDRFDFAFAHKDRLCSPDESDDTRERAQSGFLKGVGQ